MAARFAEGGLMIIGGIFILSPALEPYRNGIYEHIHIYFFITGALVFYALLYRTRAVPRFISVWGGLAPLVLLLVTVIKLFGVQYAPLDALVLNEVFLAVWLMVKGFTLLSPANTPSRNTTTSPFSTDETQRSHKQVGMEAGLTTPFGKGLPVSQGQLREP